MSKRIGAVRLGIYSAVEHLHRPAAEWRFVGYSASLAHPNAAGIDLAARNMLPAVLAELGSF